MRARSLAPIFGAALLAGVSGSVSAFTLEEATIPDVMAAFRSGELSCRGLVTAYQKRIAAYDHQGPALNAVLTLNPKALDQADALDARYKASGPVGPLHCIPVLLKDNYNTAEMPTTAGSAALAGMQPDKDAFVVAKLRKAGAIILGKTNLHEMALSGTSASSLGGQTLNPYDLTRTPGGSSGGTGAAIAANFAMIGTGSDTVNSIRSPASANSLVGFRPTAGLLSRGGIVPVSSTQDVIGPIGRSVADVALMLAVMKGEDPADGITAASRGKAPANYRASLDPDGLKGARIGVVKPLFGDKPVNAEVNAVMDRAVAAMKAAGATIVEVDDPALEAGKLNAENDVQKYEFASLMAGYLASIPNAPVHSVTELVATGKYHKPSLEKFLQGAVLVQDGFNDPDYKLRLQRNAATRTATLAALDGQKLDALVYPLQKRLVVPVGELNQAERNGILAGVTGLPAITVPAGFSPPATTAPLGVPVGMDILGRAWSEPTLLKIAYAFEQAVHVRKPPESTPPLAP